MSHETPGKAPETRMTQIVFPGDTNHYNSLFGGIAIGWMDQAAYIAAVRWCRRKVVTRHTSEIDFREPVRAGEIVELVAWITRTGRTSMRVRVDLWVEQVLSDRRTLACTGEFVMVALDENDHPTPVPPLMV